MIGLLFCVTIYVIIAIYYTSVFEPQLISVRYINSFIVNCSARASHLRPHRTRRVGSVWVLRWIDAEMDKAACHYHPTSRIVPVHLQARASPPKNRAICRNLHAFQCFFKSRISQLGVGNRLMESDPLFPVCFSHGEKTLGGASRCFIGLKRWIVIRTIGGLCDGNTVTTSLSLRIRM